MAQCLCLNDYQYFISEQNYFASYVIIIIIIAIIIITIIVIIDIITTCNWRMSYLGLS